MTVPLRIQRRRTKGYRLPEGTIYVGRPTAFGNPWTHAKTLATKLFREDMISHVNVNEYRGWLEADAEKELKFPLYVELREQKRRLLERLPSLLGFNLACYCPLCPAHRDGKPLDVECPDCSPCHVDVLGQLLYQGRNGQ